MGVFFEILVSTVAELADATRKAVKCRDCEEACL